MDGLEELVSAAGVSRVDFGGGYDPTVPVGATDRLVRALGQSYQ